MESISDDFFSSVIDAAPDAMLIVDGDGVITLANRQAEGLFGTSREALVGSSVDDLLPAEARARHRAHRSRFEAEPSVRPMGVGLLLQAQRVDGRQFPVEVSLSPLHDGAHSVVAAVRDVTGRLQAEEELRRSQAALREAEQVMAVADDRERIARDLHDIVIQRIFASGLALQALSQRAEPAVALRLERIVDDLDATISEIRTSIFALQTASTESTGVRSRVLDVVQEGADALGFEPGIQFDGPIDSIDVAVEDHLLAVVREALTNVARHAHASAVILHLEVVESTLTLTVTDDGIGRSGEPCSGNGLPNMSWRAEALGGALTVGDADPRGTRVVWRVPAHGRPVAEPVP